MNPPDLFDNIGRALYGDHYVAPMTVLLNASKNTVRKWRSGENIIPPGVWKQLADEVGKREKEVSHLLASVKLLVDNLDY